VIVTKLDRLGRSTRELLGLVERIGDADASFKSMGRLVQQSPAAGAYRQHPAGRGRERYYAMVAETAVAA
jgi:hypothetical protein